MQSEDENSYVNLESPESLNENKLVVGTFDLDEESNSGESNHALSPTVTTSDELSLMDMKVQLKEAQYKNAMAETEIANLKIQVIIAVKQGWATCGPRAIFMWPARPLEEKLIIWMNIMWTFARVLGMARDRNRNSFSARSSKKVAHHCCKG